MDNMRYTSTIDMSISNSNDNTDNLHLLIHSIGSFFSFVTIRASEMMMWLDAKWKWDDTATMQMDSIDDDERESEVITMFRGVECGTAPSMHDHTDNSIEGRYSKGLHSGESLEVVAP